MKTDVLIIGAGPTGLALACQLIRYGVEFVIIDKKETTTPYSKAVGVQARTLEIYEQMGLADELVALGTIAERTRLFAGGKLRGEAQFSELGKGLSPYPFVLIVEQGKHEKLLYDHIRSHGHDVQWQAELLTFEQAEHEVNAEIRDAHGGARTITAKYMVGGDGAKSPVRRALGLEFSGSTFDRMFYVADVDIDWEFGHDALQVFLMKNSLLAFFPMTGEKQYRIVGTFPEGFAKDEGEVLYDEIEEQIKTDSEVELDITKVNWFSTYRVHTRHVDKFSVGRVFLAGDSAHIHSPAGGQGMNTGIQDGYNLAWKLSFVLRGDASDILLSTYNEERLPIARLLTRTTDRFFGLVADPSPLLAFARIWVFPYIASFLFSLEVVKRFVFPRISQIMINYRGRALSRESGKFSVHAGDRMPYFLIDGESVYDGMRDAKFHLIAFGDEVPEVSIPDEMLDRGEIPITPEVIRIFGTDQPFLLLVRPDNYIGLISNDMSVEMISAYFEEAVTS
ncbi:MAG TPA: FAD-dependent monooxygenase [Pyrinomonadaceae bacterium]|nr:FAD-dependent monooxygenase [Pyrinomonadaceae bacterium]